MHAWEEWPELFRGEAVPSDRSAQQLLDMWHRLIIHAIERSNAGAAEEDTQNSVRRGRLGYPRPTP